MASKNPSFQLTFGTVEIRLQHPKSIMEIEFVAEKPQTFWMMQPHEYGFLSNVNPNIPHPRWPQHKSFWLGSQRWFRTPIFKGYERYVAHCAQTNRAKTSAR